MIEWISRRQLRKKRARRRWTGAYFVCLAFNALELPFRRSPSLSRPSRGGTVSHISRPFPRSRSRAAPIRSADRLRSNTSLTPVRVGPCPLLAESVKDAAAVGSRRMAIVVLTVAAASAIILETPGGRSISCRREVGVDPSCRPALWRSPWRSAASPTMVPGGSIGFGFFRLHADRNAAQRLPRGETPFAFRCRSVAWRATCGRRAGRSRSRRWSGARSLHANELLLLARRAAW